MDAGEIVFNKMTKSTPVRVIMLNEYLIIRGLFIVVRADDYIPMDDR